MKKIHWYPGHMSKSARMIEENLKLVDVLIELLDARIPYSSKNPDIDKITRNKVRVIALNKSDLSDAKINNEWCNYYKKQGFETVLINSINARGIDKLEDICFKLFDEKNKAKKDRGRIYKPLRAMVIGIPNVGKSTFINKLVGKKSAKTGDRPGVTRGKQWIKTKRGIELLDTPGILWPKIDDEEVAKNLALTGAIKDSVLDIDSLAMKYIELMLKTNKNALVERYKLENPEGKESLEVYDEIARNRGFLIKGGRIDYERTAYMLLDEFRGTKVGKISLERPLDFSL